MGAPVSSTAGPQLEAPIDIVGWYADLIERFDWVEDLGERDTFAGRHHRWIEKEGAGVVAAITAYNYPIQLALAKLAPALAAGWSAASPRPSTRATSSAASSRRSNHRASAAWQFPSPLVTLQPSRSNRWHSTGDSSNGGRQ